MKTPDLVGSIDDCLPQTQCTRCGYPRCLDYARAIANGGAAINRCPPGGASTIAALSELLDQPVVALDPDCGVHEPRQQAVIDEAVCIGCWKCIDVCPVDAIVGARRLMHTVIASECNGCALCVPVCPVDCINMIPVSVAPDPASRWPEFPRADTARWRRLTENRLARLRVRLASRRPRTPTAAERARIRAEIDAAVKRVRSRRHRA